MTFKTVLASTAIAAALATSAMAAETFTGPYAGVNFGYGAGHIDAKTTAKHGAGTESTKNNNGLKGVIGGLHLGYQKDFGQFVAGLEASANLSNTEGKNRADKYSSSLKRKNAYGIAARLGMTLNTWLAYVKLGYESAQFEAKFTDTFAAAPNQINGKKKSRINGFVPGFGMETKLTPNVMFGGEWTYSMYSRKTYKAAAGTTEVTAKSKPSIGDFKLRLSYKF
jgi:hypothetical protein